MMVTVGNVRDHIRDGKVVMPEHAVYVGRAVKRYGLEASPLENPFVIGAPADVLVPCGEGLLRWERRQRAARPDVINAFEHNILRPALRLCNQLPQDHQFFRIGSEFYRIQRLQGDLLLLCWCAPKVCHGDVIKKRLEERNAT